MFDSWAFGVTLGELFSFMIGSILIVLSPGPSSLCVLRSSMQSARLGYAAMCGVVLADATYIFASFLGVSAILYTQPVLWSSLVMVGSAYLAYMGWGMLRKPYDVGLVARSSFTGRNAVHTTNHTIQYRRQQGRKHFMQGLFITFANVKSIGFAAGFFPLFLPDPAIVGGRLWPSFVFLATVFTCISCMYLTLVIYMGSHSWIKRLDVRGRKNFRLGFQAIGIVIMVGSLWSFGAAFASLRSA